jgi:hypothetical protein
LILPPPLLLLLLAAGSPLLAAAFLAAPARAHSPLSSGPCMQHSNNSNSSSIRGQIVDVAVQRTLCLAGSAAPGHAGSVPFLLQGRKMYWLAIHSNHAFKQQLQQRVDSSSSPAIIVLLQVALSTAHLAVLAVCCKQLHRVLLMSMPQQSLPS